MLWSLLVAILVGWTTDKILLEHQAILPDVEVQAVIEQPAGALGVRSSTLL